MRNDAADRVLIVFSDMLETRPPDSPPVRFELNGARVLLIHRAAANEPGSAAAYVARLRGWSDRLKSAGATSVSLLPVRGVAFRSLKNTLSADADGAPALVMVAIDTKAGFPAKEGSEKLRVIARGISDVAWENGCLTLWAAFTERGVFPRTVPVVDYHPRPIARSDEINKREDFATRNDRIAVNFWQLGHRPTATDLAGTLAVLGGADDSRHSRRILVIVSDLIDAAPAGFRGQVWLKGAVVVLVYRPSPADAADQNRFFSRLRDWEQHLVALGSRVCPLPMASLTPNEISGCIS
jgi:hypothetical protein